MLKNKSQMNHAFTFIMIVLLIGLIAVFGYKGISRIMNVNCDQQRIMFERDLLEYIDAYSARGTVQEKVLTTPCGMAEICFVDSKYYEPQSGIVPANIDNAVIESNIRSKSNNIFIKAEFTEPIGFSEKVSLEDDVVCFKIIGDSLKIVFRGQGRTTLIKQS